jgi:HK97 family phage portal protein
MANALVRLARSVLNALPRTKGHLQTVSDNRGGWWPWIREAYPGAWQRDDEWTTDTVLAHHAVYACITLIASDVAKLQPRLMELDSDGIWNETEVSAFSPVLRKPNRYQNRIQFIEWWEASKLIHGNTYVLKERDGRTGVRALYILDPSRVQVMVSPDGSVFYSLQADNLTGIEQDTVPIPASEIIHDRINCLFHPLVGVSPIFASGLAANIGINIERNSSFFFKNGSNPSGILTAPGTIDDPTAKKLAERWNAMYGGEKSGRVAVLGNGLSFEPLRMTAVDSQLIEQLKWTTETVCSAFHVPPWKIGSGPLPANQSAEIANQIYYSDCLQSHIEQWELCMDEGLGLDTSVGNPRRRLGVELDLDGLLRMDSATQIKTLVEGIRGGLYTPNGARKKVNESPLPGGGTVYMQHQNYGIEALSRRDAREDPFASTSTGSAPPPAQPNDDDNADEERAAFVTATNMRLLAFDTALRTKLLEAQ